MSPPEAQYHAVPYPYYSGWSPEKYLPYRKNGIADVLAYSAQMMNKTTTAQLAEVVKSMLVPQKIKDDVGIDFGPRVRARPNHTIDEARALD